MPVSTSPDAALGHAGIAGGVDRHAPVRAADHGARALEREADAGGRGAKLPRRPRCRSPCTASIVVPEHARHLARMRGEGARARARRRSRSRCPASALSASASTTMGRSTSATARGPAPASPGRSESPGPSATASMRRASSRMRSLRLERERAARRSRAAPRSCTRARARRRWAAARPATAIVQRPTPLRSAARPASTAAPVLPSDPATTRRWPKRPLWASGSRGGKDAAHVGGLEAPRGDAARDLRGGHADVDDVDGARPARRPDGAAGSA